MEGSRTLFCSSQFPWVCESISLKFIDHLGRQPEKGVLALVWGMITVTLENVCYICVTFITFLAAFV
jgi:hypothetical protein